MAPHPPADRLDIDVRFLLANERTLLAWLRTALTLMAGGVALVQFSHERHMLQFVGLSLLGLGSVGAVIGYRRYRAAGQAIRVGRLPPPGRGPVLMTAGVIAVAAATFTVCLLS